MKKNILFISGVFFFSVLIISGAAGKAVPVKTGKNPKISVSEKEKAKFEKVSQEIEKIKNPQVPRPPGVLRTTINLVISLLLVIGLIYLFMVTLKFFYVKASIPLKSEGIVKVLAKEHIDSKKIMYVIEFGDRVVLLGSAGESLNVLSEIKDRQEVDRIKERADEYIAKYRMKNESKFSEELKSSYLKQGKKIVNAGNEAVKKMMDKLKKKEGK